MDPVAAGRYLDAGGVRMQRMGPELVFKEVDPTVGVEVGGSIERAGGENFSEVMWLEGRLAEARETLAATEEKT